MTTKKEIMIGSNENTDSNNYSKQSILALDLIRSILDRLSFVDFHRARCVSSDWYSASKSCTIRVMDPTNPWIVLFPKESNNKSSCKLFNPHDRQYYTAKHPGFDFPRSRCLASCGSWLLMLDHRTDFHILLVFTRKRISLPSLESTDTKEISFKRTGDSDFMVTHHYKDAGKYSYRGKNTRIGKAVLWVDEKSKDYLVVWSYDKNFIYQKKEDDHDKNIWKVLQPLKNEGCVDMVYKESKLYVLREIGGVTVFDFYGGDSPMEGARFTCPNYYRQKPWKNNLAVTLCGEFLFIESHVNFVWNLIVYKLDFESSQWSFIESLGDEALLLGEGTTVAAKDGVMKNCICFSSGQHPQFPTYLNNRLHTNESICSVRYQSRNLIQVVNHASSPIPYKDGRWFSPTFGG